VNSEVHAFLPREQFNVLPKAFLSGSSPGELGPRHHHDPYQIALERRNSSDMALNMWANSRLFSQCGVVLEKSNFGLLTIIRVSPSPPSGAIACMARGYTNRATRHQRRTA